MPTRPPLHVPLGYSKRSRNIVSDNHRGSASDRGYDGRWQKASRSHRRKNPLCVYCAALGHVTPAALVDHLYPHKGNGQIFWISELWVSCCIRCHNGFKQSIEREGTLAIDQLAHSLGLPTLAQAMRQSYPD